AKIIAPGKLYIYGIQENKSEAQPARGAVAFIFFKALQKGNTQFSFNCENNTQPTSQIITLNSNLENIINCDVTSTHTVSISITDSSILVSFTDNAGLS